jgi:hypothetical protein
MLVIAVIGGAYFVTGRPDRGVSRHRRESLGQPEVAAEQPGSA